MRVSVEYIHHLIYKHKKEHLDKIFAEDFSRYREDIRYIFGPDIHFCGYDNTFYESNLSYSQRKELGDFVQIFYTRMGTYQVHIKNKDYAFTLTFYKNFSCCVVDSENNISKSVTYAELEKDIDYIQDTLTADVLFDIDMKSFYEKILKEEYKI